MTLENWPWEGASVLREHSFMMRKAGIEGMQKQLQIMQKPRMEDVNVIPIRSILHKCGFMNFEDADGCVCVSHFPNFYERD